METNAFFRLFPTKASTFAGDVDALYLFLSAMTAVLALGIAATIVYFVVKYRQGGGKEGSGAGHTRLSLEIIWSVIPLVVSVVIFVWSARIYLRMFDSPANSQEIHVIGKQWMWKFQHPQGPREIDRLHIPVGRPIKLVMISQDVIHSLYIPAFRVKHDVLPGRYTTLWFEAAKTGRYHLFCAEYCGTRHYNMRGDVEVMEPHKYEEWISTGGQGDPVAVRTLAQQGEDLFRSLGCSGCHAPGSPIRAPLLEGAFGKPVPLAQGDIVITDEEYLRESIYFPQRKIVAGYEPIMPSFEGVVSEEQMIALIAYIKSLGAESAPAGTGNDPRQTTGEMP